LLQKFLCSFGRVTGALVKRLQFNPDYCFSEAGEDRGSMSGQTKESFTASLPSSPARAAVVGWGVRFPAV